MSVFSEEEKRRQNKLKKIIYVRSPVLLNSKGTGLFPVIERRLTAAVKNGVKIELAKLKNPPQKS